MSSRISSQQSRQNCRTTGGVEYCVRRATVPSWPQRAHGAAGSRGDGPSSDGMHTRFDITISMDSTGLSRSNEKSSAARPRGPLALMLLHKDRGRDFLRVPDPRLQHPLVRSASQRTRGSHNVRTDTWSRVCALAPSSSRRSSRLASVSLRPIRPASSRRTSGRARSRVPFAQRTSGTSPTVSSSRSFDLR